MGLYTTHGCWSSSYSSFMRWRIKICEVAGYGNIRDREGFNGSIPWPEDDPLSILLYHSDCDDDIRWQDCKNIAARLEELLPTLEAAGDDFVEKTQTFINGLRFAANQKENVEFQ